MSTTTRTSSEARVCLDALKKEITHVVKILRNRENTPAAQVNGLGIDAETKPSPDGSEGGARPARRPPRGFPRRRDPNRRRHADDGLQSPLCLLLSGARAPAGDGRGGPRRGDPPAGHLGPRQAEADSPRWRASPFAAARPGPPWHCPGKGGAPGAAP